MMAGVTRMGTAHKAFYDRPGRPRLPFSAAGKTGTLYGKADGDIVGYSWFVGFAPIQNPTIAFAIALGNKPGRQLRASELARELLAEYAAARPDAAPHDDRLRAQMIRVRMLVGSAAMRWRTSAETSWSRSMIR